MNWQVCARRLSSTWLKTALLNGLSVIAVPPGVACRVVPHACAPLAKFELFGDEASQLAPCATVVDSNLTTMDPGTAAVSVLLVKSFLTESETSAFGVTAQAQQEIISSVGSNV